MEASRFPPPPTYAEPTIVDEKTKKASFNPIWLKWFLDVAQGIEDATTQLRNGLNHDNLLNLQGGIAPNEFYHLSAAQASDLFVNPLTTTGDIILEVGGVPTRLPIGTSGQVLTVVAGVPAWV